MAQLCTHATTRREPYIVVALSTYGAVLQIDREADMYTPYVAVLICRYRGQVDTKADVYSFGIVLAEIYTQRLGTFRERIPQYDTAEQWFRQLLDVLPLSS